MPPSIFSMLTAVVVVTLMAYILINDAVFFGTTNSVNALTGQAYNSTQQLTAYRSNLSSEAYSSNGLGANVQQFTGLAFIYPAMLGFATTLSNIGPLMGWMISINIQTSGLATYSGLPVSTITNLFDTIMGIVLVGIFVGAYLKVDFLNLGR